jgi:hypothetical protein
MYQVSRYLSIHVLKTFKTELFVPIKKFTTSNYFRGVQQCHYFHLKGKKVAQLQKVFWFCNQKKPLANDPNVHVTYNL